MAVYHRTGTPCHGAGECPFSPGEHFASIAALIELLIDEEVMRRSPATDARTGIV